MADRFGLLQVCERPAHVGRFFFQFPAPCRRRAGENLGRPPASRPASPNINRYPTPDTSTYDDITTVIVRCCVKQHCRVPTRRHPTYTGGLGEERAKEVIAFCGLEWDDKCLKFHESDRPVKTASVSQVRKPIYTSSVARWRRYGDGLKPLVDALEEAGVKVT